MKILNSKSTSMSSTLTILGFLWGAGPLVKADDLLIKAGGAWVPDQPAVAYSLWFDLDPNGFTSGGGCSSSKPALELTQTTSQTNPTYNDFKFTVNCDRSGQSDLAALFNRSLYREGPQQLNPAYNQGNAIQYFGVRDYSTADPNPDKLNWVISGRLSIWGDDSKGNKAADSYNVVIGQGHTGAYNNWWIGGADVTGFVTSGTLMTNDGKYVITPGGNDSTFVAYKYQWPKSEWMKNVPDSSPISSLSMPRTHDTGTYAYIGPDNTITMTQNLSIRGQLGLGVRMFDIRLTDQLQITHGSQNVHLYLTDVIRFC